jgi:hypothetical protein
MGDIISIKQISTLYNGVRAKRQEYVTHAASKDGGFSAMKSTSKL